MCPAPSRRAAITWRDSLRPRHNKECGDAQPDDDADGRHDRRDAQAQAYHDQRKAPNEHRYAKEPSFVRETAPAHSVPVLDEHLAHGDGTNGVRPNRDSVSNHRQARPSKLNVEALLAGLVFLLTGCFGLAYGAGAWLPPLASRHGASIDAMLTYLLVTVVRSSQSVTWPSASSSGAPRGSGASHIDWPAGKPSGSCRRPSGS